MRIASSEIARRGDASADTRAARGRRPRAGRPRAGAPFPRARVAPERRRAGSRRRPRLPPAPFPPGRSAASARRRPRPPPCRPRERCRRAPRPAPPSPRPLRGPARRAPRRPAAFSSPRGRHVMTLCSRPGVRERELFPRAPGSPVSLGLPPPSADPRQSDRPAVLGSARPGAFHLSRHLALRRAALEPSLADLLGPPRPARGRRGLRRRARGQARAAVLPGGRRGARAPGPFPAGEGCPRDSHAGLPLPRPRVPVPARPADLLPRPRPDDPGRVRQARPGAGPGARAAGLGLLGRARGPDGRSGSPTRRGPWWMRSW